MIWNYLKNFGKSKKRKETPKITWKIITICRPYNPNSKRCLLCLNEKYEIATCKETTFYTKELK